MKKVYQAISAMLCLALVMSVAALAQGPRDPVTSTQTTTKKTTPPPPPAPTTVKVKYEGGVFGYNKKMDGFLTFDDANERLLFRNKQQQEVLSIPYKSVVAAFADTQSKRPTAATVIGSASIYTLPALLIKKKYRYLTLQYNDPDTRINGVTSFKMENKEILASVLNTLANKAGLTARGEVFVRRAETTNANIQ